MYALDFQSVPAVSLVTQPRPDMTPGQFNKILRPDPPPYPAAPHTRRPYYLDRRPVTSLLLTCCRKTNTVLPRFFSHTYTHIHTHINHNRYIHTLSLVSRRTYRKCASLPQDVDTTFLIVVCKNHFANIHLEIYFLYISI